MIQYERRVLVACEYSGTVRDAFSRRGWDAWSCDLLPTESILTKEEDKHFQCDVFIPVQRIKWDLLIAFPPCTYLCNSGVSWLHKYTQRWIKMYEASDFFERLLNSDIQNICIENPIQHKYATRLIKKPYTQIIQPYMFGHMESKATCLWLKNLPLLVETNNVKALMQKLPDNKRQRLHYLAPSPDRAKIRSKTYTGIADAMADQWTEYFKAIETTQQINNHLFNNFKN